LFLITASGDPVIFHAGEFSVPTRDWSQMFHGQIETDVAIKIPVGRIAWITFVRAPDLPARITIARKSRWPRWRITRRINRAAGLRFSKQQAVCLQNEPANICFLKNCLQPGRISTFWQPKSRRLCGEK